MTITEYHSWIAFYGLEPFGDVRADLRSGIVAALIARTMGGRKHATPIEYMPVVDKQRREAEEAMTQRAKNAAIRQTFEGNLGGARVRRVRLTRRRK